MKTESEKNISIHLNKPENLVIEDLIQSDFPFFIRIRKDDGSNSWEIKTGKSIRKHIPALYYFIHVLLERQHSDVDALRCWYAKDFIEMFSRDIEPVKSKNDFRLIWGILNTLMVIEYHDDTKPNKYRKSAKAYYFRLTQSYLNSKVIEHEVMFKESTVKKIFQKWGKKPVNDTPAVDLSTISFSKHLMHQYQSLHNIRFNSEAATEFTNNLYAKGLLTSKQYNTYQISINNIKNGRIKITHSPSCHRFFTSVTEMPRELRQFIHDNEGKSLTELDFSSFNAFAVYRLLNSFTPEYDSDIKKIAYETEIDLYRRILSRGDFYNSFKEMFFSEEELNREQVKDIILKKWFNGKLNSKNKHRVYLKKRLPRISEVIDCLKVERYENFSNTMMRMESELVNDIIYRKFIEIYPDAIIYTIFDSFLVEQKYSAKLQSMMQEEGSRYFNLNCTVKEK